MSLNIKQFTDYFWRKDKIPALRILKICSSGNDAENVFLNVFASYKKHQSFALTLIFPKKFVENLIKILQREKQ